MWRRQSMAHAWFCTRPQDSAGLCVVCCVCIFALHVCVHAMFVCVCRWGTCSVWRRQSMAHAWLCTRPQYSAGACVVCCVCIFALHVCVHAMFVCVCVGGGHTQCGGGKVWHTFGFAQGLKILQEHVLCVHVLCIFVCALCNICVCVCVSVGDIIIWRRHAWLCSNLPDSADTKKCSRICFG